MHVYEVDAASPFQVFRAGVKLTETFRAVTLTSNGVEPCEFDSRPIGILMSNLADAGEEVYILVTGGGRLELGEDVCAGDLLTIGDGGLGYKLTDSEFLFARALESGTAGSVIAVVIVNAGCVNVFFDEDESWNVVKLMWGFPISRHRRHRGISLPNPKDGLTKEEIIAAGNYAVEHGLLMNEAKEIADKFLGAALKRRTVEIIRL